jgi:hypothetical protein
LKTGRPRSQLLNGTSLPPVKLCVELSATLGRYFVNARGETQQQRFHRVLDMACMLSDRNFKRWRQAVEAYPLEVFVVTSGSYSDYRIVSIHPTLREAMDTCPEVGSWELEEDKLGFPRLRRR